mgnify:CR=1 FL=1
MLLCELGLAAEERGAFLERGRPDAVFAAIRTDVGFSAAEEDKVAAFGVASVDMASPLFFTEDSVPQSKSDKTPFLAGAWGSMVY